MYKGIFFTVNGVLPRLKRLMLEEFIESLMPSKHKNQDEKDFLFTCTALQRFGVTIDGKQHLAAIP